MVKITGNHYNGRFTLTSWITGGQHRRYKEEWLYYILNTVNFDSVFPDADDTVDSEAVAELKLRITQMEMDLEVR